MIIILDLVLFYFHSCLHCNQYYWDLAALEKHSKTHQKIGPFLCDTCGMEFKRYGLLRAHNNSSHSKSEQAFQCFMCKKSYRSRQILRMHMNSHSIIFKCNLCGQVCSSKASLYRHAKMHRVENSFTCDVCGKGFYDRSRLTVWFIIFCNK